MKWNQHKSAGGRLVQRLWLIHVAFSLAGAIALFVGVAVMLENYRQHAFENACLATLSKAESQIAVARLIDRERLQSVVDQLSGTDGLVECSVTGADGTYLVHTDASKNGKIHQEPDGQRRGLNGGIEVVRFHGPSGARLRQYAVALNKGRDFDGVLRLTFRDVPTWLASTISRPGLPLLLLLPLGLALVGGRCLLRALSPIIDITGQLEKMAATHSVSQIELKPSRRGGAIAAGWNRLCEFWDVNYRQGSLADRLKSAIAECEQDRCRELLESLPVGIAETDHEGNIEFINRAMQSLLNLDADGVENTRIDDQLLAIDDPELSRQLFGGDAWDREVTVEIQCDSPVGQRCLRVSRHPLDTPQGRRLAWEIRDVTQAKLAEKARDEFLDSATHEIRTPLANIKAYAETLTLTEMTDLEQQKEFCNVINTEATRLSRLIDELLDISSIEAGSLSINRQHVEVARLLEEVVAKVQPQMTQKDITFETVFSDKLPELDLDKDKFATCLVNLLGNAAKYTPAGGHVTFRARVEADKLILDVEDTGIGIPEDELPKVFEKFYRGKDQRVHHENGTGLGLAFTREVINLHNGSLTAQSEVDHGSTFTITMPVG